MTTHSLLALGVGPFGSICIRTCTLHAITNSKFHSTVYILHVFSLYIFFIYLLYVFSLSPTSKSHCLWPTDSLHWSVVDIHSIPLLKILAVCIYPGGKYAH